LQDYLMDLTALPITHRQAIPESYRDEMGHMNVMWYTHLFSQATGRLFELVGMTAEYFQANQAGTFALENHVRYLAEVLPGKEVTIRSRLLGRSAKRLHFMNFMVVAGQEVVAATGEYIAAHIDMRVRRTSPFPPPIADAIDRVLAGHARLNWEPPVCGVMKP
jgi:acyl-CoA thioesterase FadM